VPVSSVLGLFGEISSQFLAVRDIPLFFDHPTAKVIARRIFSRSSQHCGRITFLIHNTKVSHCVRQIDHPERCTMARVGLDDWDVPGMFVYCYGTAEDLESI
jgi:hypothetical protein